jgi:hypothetical protein
LDGNDSARRSHVAADAIERLWSAGELGQRTEGRRIDVTVGPVWSVVEAALASPNKVRLRLRRVAEFAPAADVAETKGTPSRGMDG